MLKTVPSTPTSELLSHRPHFICTSYNLNLYMTENKEKLYGPLLAIHKNVEEAFSKHCLHNMAYQTWFL